MPFASRSQQKYLYAKHPEIAEEFASKTPKSAYKRLPEHVQKGGRFKSYLNKPQRKKDVQ